MKLYKALKLRKSLIGEIAKLKQQIREKNSYLEGSVNAEKFNVEKAFDELLNKTDELTGLKFVINEANREIQSKIYVLGEYKALISFLNEIDVTEGSRTVGFSESSVRNYKVQMDEIQRNDKVKEYQKRVDALQEEIDIYNYTTEIPWDEIDTRLMEE